MHKGNSHLTLKIVEFLASGVTLAFSRGEQRKRLHGICDEVWYSIDRKLLYQALRRLRMQGVIEIIKGNDGIERVKLTRRAAVRGLESKLQSLEMKKPPRKWDKRWRVVMFDVPEEKKTIRDRFRRKLLELGFTEFQRSVFVYPYSCRDEINFMINFWGIPENVFYIEAPIECDDALRKKFKLR